MSAPRRDREPAAGNTLAPEENRWDRFRSPRHAPALDTRIVTSAPFVAIIGLADRAHDAVKTFSSGMKRRLNIAAALLHRPRVLFLDEPTVGVDPQSRNLIFEQIERLKAEGMTLIDGQARIIARRVSVDHAVAGERTAGLLVLQVSLIDEHRAPPDLVGLPL
ncbi:MAG: ATP-binding cassette domain-containing protein [Chloroflexi bacterium]|nr:ATP-binding cassette domain-containing protein [Chloroflexota bacterium]